MYPNNSVRVPAPFDELLEPPRRIDPNHPPFLPALRMTEELDRYVPYLVGSLMAVIQNEVADGPRQGNEARTIFYNTMSYNGWRNKEMEDACAFAADYVEAIVFREQLFDRVQRVIDGEVENIVGMLVAMQIKRYPDIETFYGPDVVAEITMQQRKFTQALDLISDHRRRLADGAQQSRYDPRDRGYGRDDRRDDRFANRYPQDNRGGRYDDRRDPRDSYRDDRPDDYRGGGRGAQAYGERMRQQNRGYGPDPRQSQGHRPSGLYSNTPRQPSRGGYGQATPSGRPMPHNPYAAMLEKRAKKWEDEHSQERRTHAAPVERAPQRTPYREPEQVETRGAQPQRAPLNRPNLRRDAPIQEERLSSLMPWEDGYEEREREIAQQDQNRVVSPATTQPTGAPMNGINLMIVDNPTAYEVDEGLNEGAACYTIEFNSPFTWKPSPKQWHKPSYRPEDEVRLIKLLNDDTVVYEIFDKTQPLPKLTFFKGQESVDFLKHIAPHSSLKRTGFVSSEEYQARHTKVMTEGLVKDATEQRRLRDENRSAEKEGLPPAHSAEEIEQAMKCIMVEARHAIDTSDLGMLTSVDLNKRREQKKHTLPILAYRNYALKVETRVAEDTINNPEYDDASIHLDMLREAETYKEAAFVLDKLRRDPGADPVVVQLANDRIIKAVNRQLRYNLSISGLAVSDNFDAKTVEALDNILKTQYGTYVFEKFRDHQASILQQIFVQEGETTVKAMNEYYNTDGLDDIKLYHMVSRHSVTLLDLRLADLKREIDPDTGSVIDETNGLTWVILKNLTEKGNRIGNESAMKLYRQLIRLADGTLLELHHGHLAQGSLILSYAEPF